VFFSVNPWRILFIMGPWHELELDRFYRTAYRDPHDSEEVLRMPTRSYRWLFITLAVLGLVLDQASKYGMFRWLYNDGVMETRGAFKTYARGPNEPVVHGEYDLWHNVFQFTAEYEPDRPADSNTIIRRLQTWSAPVMPRVNYGALFGLGGGAKGAANGLFAAVCLIAAGAIGFWITRPSAANDRWLCAALGLIIAGTLGNFYDRVIFGGVRDFLHFYAINWPVFNIADCCLVVGAGILLVQAIFVPAEPTPAPVVTGTTTSAKVNVEAKTVG
jgi:signal peptidase II